jgi:hypothetical protein
MAIKLPSRNYFTFPELMARWQCTENDLRALIIDEALKPSYFFPPEVIYRVCKLQPNGSVLVEELDDEEKFYNTSAFYLQTPTQNALFDCQFTLFTRKRTPPKLIKGEPGEVYMLEEPLDLNHVLQKGAVMMEELAFVESQLMEQEIDSSDKPLSTKERNTLLTIVAVLLELIQSHKPGRDSEAAVITEMLQNYDEKSGISKRNLEQKFAEAKRILGSQ